MPDPTTPNRPPLSPAAQAVKSAVLATYADNVRKDDALWALERPSTVAALRAAADQPYDVPVWIQGDAYWVYRNAVDAERERSRAIAAELEADQLTSGNV